MLHIDRLSISFPASAGRTRALNELSLSVGPGEILAIVGESGSGKSLTALSVMRLLATPPARYDSGKILFSADGETAVDLLGLPPRDLEAIRGNRIGMIFQEPMSSLNPVMRCGKQVMESLIRHRGLSRETARAETRALFEKVKLPDPARMLDAYPHELSGGQKQRVMIAMAMACKPALLICDEPTTALDVTVQKTILDLIRQLTRETNTGVIFITHDLGVVAGIADRCLVLFRGDVVEEGPVKEIFTAPKHPYTRGLLLCRPGLHAKGERLPVVADFLSGNPAAASPGRVSPPRESVSEDDADDVAGVPATLIEARDLVVRYPAGRDMLGRPVRWTTALDRVNLAVRKGETLGLVGESGCGKTTLGRALLRLIEPASGDILYRGELLTGRTQRALRRFRKEIQIVFQDPYSSLNPMIAVGDAIAEPMRTHAAEKPGGEWATAAARRERAAELMEKVGLSASLMNRYPHEFSGGQRQRIVIARALALDPGFVVFDESVSALDVSVQAQVLNLLNDLKAEFGFTVVFISHDLSVVRYISDRIAVMNGGRIVEFGPAEEVYRHPREEYTRRLIASIPSAGPIESFF